MAKRSGNWTCPVCGVPNKDILPDATEGNSQQLSSLEEEASQIATQMAFQSEAEVKARLQQQQQQQQGTAAPEAQLEQVQSDCASMTSAHLHVPDPSAPLTPPMSPFGGVAPRSEDVISGQEQYPDLRHRQPNAHQEEGPMTQATVRVDGQRTKPSGTVSYVIMWLLILAIVGLFLRRLLFF